MLCSAPVLRSRPGNGPARYNDSVALAKERIGPRDNLLLGKNRMELPSPSLTEKIRSKAPSTFLPFEKEVDRYRVGHLATADGKAKPLVMPLCFACHGGAIYSVVDEKPKKVPASRLRRLRHIAENPQVSLLVDHYEEDWRRLSYFLVEGCAQVLRSGQEHAAALRKLRRKYPQYGVMALEDKPVIKISPKRVIHWKFTGQAATD
jgi:PPOX class probable F420-dependent enzyme